MPPPPEDNSLRTTGGNWRWEPPAPAEVQRMLPQYEVEKLIGRGGMGAVYRGIQLSLERPVAIKLLPPVIEKQDPAFAERFKNEAKLMGRLNHPAIVSVYDFGRTNEGQLYFVMEYIDGTDVQQMIASHGKLPADHALAITAHVCDALGYAHKQGVIHRDIKPSNILIDSDGRVKVADFGLAKVAGDDGHSRGLTQTGMTMGTPDYVAPESLILGIQVDGRADLYAVGVMLYQMLTGDLPRGMFKMPSQKVPGVDPRFDRIVRRALEQDREERYQSSGEIRRDLDVILTTPLVESGKQSSSAIPRQVAQEVPGRGKVPAHLQRQPRAPVHHEEVFEELPRRSSSLPYVIAVAVIVLGGGWAVLHQPASTETPAEEPKTVETPVPVFTPEPPKPVPVPTPKPVAVVTPPTTPPSMPVTTMPKTRQPVPVAEEFPKTSIYEKLTMSQRLEMLDSIFQDTYDDKINVPYAAKIKELGAGYLKKLEDEFNAALLARRTSDAKELEEEQKRFKTHEFMPSIDPPGLAKVVIQLRDIYRKAEAGHTHQRNFNTRPYYDTYLRALSSLERQALVQRRADEAARIRVILEDVTSRRRQRALSVPASFASAPSNGTLTTPGQVISLFDGKSLDGWHIYGDPSAFRVTNGEIRTNGKQANLVYTGGSEPVPVWRNFELTMKFRTEESPSSGICFHLPDLFTLLSRPTSALKVHINSDSRTGYIFGAATFDEGTPLDGNLEPRSALFPTITNAENRLHDGVWREMRVHCLSGVFTVFIDSTQVSQWSPPKDWAPPPGSIYQHFMSGTLALQGSLTGSVAFKEITIKVL